jgi:phospholipid-transporting ATPase
MILYCGKETKISLN